MYQTGFEFIKGWIGGLVEKNPFHGGGMDIFWNYTFHFLSFCVQVN